MNADQETCAVGMEWRGEAGQNEPTAFTATLIGSAPISSPHPIYPLAKQESEQHQNGRK